MDRLIAQLESTLASQIEGHQAMHALLDEERRALVGLDIDLIHSCAHRKAALAEEIAAAEAERRELADRLAEALGLSERPVRLLNLIEALPPENRPALTRLRERLLDAIHTAGEDNGRNRTLTERFMSVVERSMLVVQQAVSGKPLYTTAAQMGHSTWRGQVVSQQA